MIAKYVKFMISRAAGTVADTLVLWLCSHFLFHSYWGDYIISPVISFEVAVMCNFLCSYFWIWRSRISERSARSFWRHFIGFNISSFAGFLVKMAFLLLFQRLFGWGVVVCNLVALCLSGVLNFVLSESVVFRKPTAKPTHQLLSVEELGEWIKFFRTRIGRLLGNFLLRAVGINRLNWLYDYICSFSGPESIHAVLDYVQCDYFVGNPERLDTLPSGAFITVSNHPYGAIDGIMLMDLITRQREDFKVMVNQILYRAEPLRPYMVAVTPTATEKKAADATTLCGIRTCMAHLREGHPMGFFPSGAVSDLHLPKGDISDRQWQESLIRLIQKARVPVVPIRFPDRNSMFYYLLGLIDWRIRLLRLPHEVLNKCRGRHRIVIGKTISVAEQQACGSTEELGALLRRAVYEMPLPENYTAASRLS